MCHLKRQRFYPRINQHSFWARIGTHLTLKCSEKKNPASLLTNFTVFKAAQKIQKNTPWIPLNVTARRCCIHAPHIFAVFLYISLETSSLDPCLLLRISFGVWPAAFDSYAPDIKPQQVAEWQKPYYSPTLRRLLPAITSSARKLLTRALLTPTSKGGSPSFTRAYIVRSLLLSITGLLLLSREIASTSHSWSELVLATGHICFLRGNHSTVTGAVRVFVAWCVLQSVCVVVRSVFASVFGNVCVCVSLSGQFSN